MKFCVKCKTALSDESVFCTACGAPVEKEEPQVSAPVSDIAPAVALKEREEAPVKAEKQKDRRVKMLVMAFISFMCAVLLPIFSFTEPFEFNLYLTDLGRISSAGKDFTNMHEGEFVSKVDGFVGSIFSEEDAESLEDLATTEGVKQAAHEFAEDAEPQILEAANELNVVFTLFFIVSALIVFAFVLLLVAAAKGLRKLYRFMCIALFGAFAGFIFLGNLFIDSDLTGNGSYLTMLMLVLSFFIPFTKGKEKA